MNFESKSCKKAAAEFGFCLDLSSVSLYCCDVPVETLKGDSHAKQ